MSDTRSAVVEDLNRLMAEEVEAFLRYFQIRFRLRGPDAIGAREIFDAALDETIDHAEALAGHIRSLGEVPTLRINLTLGGGSIRPEEAVAEALEVEQQALDAYKDLLLRVQGDARLEEFVRTQIDVETGHVEEMKDAVQSGIRLVPKPPKND